MAKKKKLIKSVELENGSKVMEYSDGTVVTFPKDYDKLYNDFDFTPEALRGLPNDADELFKEIKPNYYYAYPAEREEIKEIKMAKYLFLTDISTRIKIRLTDMQKKYMVELGIDEYVRQFCDKRFNIRMEKYGEYWLSDDNDDKLTFCFCSIGEEGAEKPKITEIKA